MRVAALAWCTEIPGLQVYLFRRLSDDLHKNHMEGPTGFPALLGEWIDQGYVKINWSKNFIEFWNGAKIHLCHCQHEKDVTKYQGAEIHCSEESTLVRMADGSSKVISEVRVGDYVATLQGPRMVKWVGERTLKPCVEAKVSFGGVVSRQIHSASHKILTPTGWISYDDIECVFHPSSTSEPIENRSSRKFDELSASARRLSPPSPESLMPGQGRTVGFSQSGLNHQSGLETSSYKAPQAQESDCESSCYDSRGSRKPSSGSPFPVVLHAPILGQAGEAFPIASLRGAGPYVPSECMHAGFESGCHPSFGSRDGCQSESEDRSHGGVRTPVDAEQHSPMRSPSDDLGKAQTHSLSGQLQYDHPYTGEERIAEEAFGLGTCVLTPCGEKWTIDMMVEGENHYITESGLVNKNCLLIDELTHFTEKIYRYLRGRCRLGGLKLPSKHLGLFPRIVAGSNPGGVGHNWVKATFVDQAAPMAVVQQGKTEGGMRRQYVPAKLADNPALLDNDPDYADRLEGLGNPELVRAMKDGDWSIVAGGMFDDVWRESVHAIKPFPIPSGWRVDRSFDWGSSKPFSVGWWAECDGTPAVLADGTEKHFPRGTLFRIGEWYGWNGRPDEGLKQSDSATATGITLRESQMGIADRVRPGPADNAIFDEENGDSPAKIQERHKVRWERSDKSPGSRKRGWSVMRERLRASMAARMEEPGLFVFDTCRQFIRTVPVLPRSETDPDDVNTKAEDHIGDEVRYRVLAVKNSSTVEKFRW